MIKRKWIYLAFVGFPIFLGNYGVLANMEVVEGPSKAPHRKISEIQVSFKPSWHARSMKEPYRSRMIKINLLSKLEEIGRHYHADAIDNVIYFPDPANPTYFRTKEYYARGSLIEYKKFSESKSQDAKAQK